jgi:plastocyanin
MRKQLIGTICLGGLSVIALLLWNPSVRAQEAVKVEINPGPAGPVLSPSDVSIAAGQSITWITNTDAAVKHQLVQELTDQFTKPTNPTHKFEITSGVIKYHCKIHPNTMKGTITVK